jgi:hypothetical protein
MKDEEQSRMGKAMCAHLPMLLAMGTGKPFAHPTLREKDFLRNRLPFIPHPSSFPLVHPL